MAFCTNCGTQLVDGAKFCSECGISTKGKTKRIIMILLIPTIAIIAGIAGVVGYLYFPELIRAKVESYIESYIPAEAFLQTTATVTANTTSLYAGQSTSTVLKTLKKGDVVIVTGLPASGWVPVKSGNITGWMLPSSIAVKR